MLKYKTQRYQLFLTVFMYPSHPYDPTMINPSYYPSYDPLSTICTLFSLGNKGKVQIDCPAQHHCIQPCPLGLTIALQRTFHMFLTVSGSSDFIKLQLTNGTLSWAIGTISSLIFTYILSRLGTPKQGSKSDPVNHVPGDTTLHSAPANSRESQFNICPVSYYHHTSFL